MPIIDSILAELDRESQTTKRLLDVIPEDKLSWKPHPKSRSLGQLAMHIAMIPGAVAAYAEEDSHEMGGGRPTPQPTSRREITDAFTANLASARESLKKMDDARVMGTWSGTRGGKTLFSMPRIGVLRTVMLNHNYHHRGQLSVYLRLLDVPLPSIYGPSADEDPFK